MSATDLDRARDAAKDELRRLRREFNTVLPRQMQEVARDVEMLKRAQENVDVSAIVAKYLP